MLPACLEAPIPKLDRQWRGAGNGRRLPGLGLHQVALAPSCPPELTTVTMWPLGSHRLGLPNSLGVSPQTGYGSCFFFLLVKKKKKKMCPNTHRKIPEKSQRFCSRLPLQRCQPQPTRLQSSRNPILGTAYSPPRLSPSVPTARTDELRLLGKQSQPTVRQGHSHVTSTPQATLGGGNLCLNGLFSDRRSLCSPG